MKKWLARVDFVDGSVEIIRFNMTNRTCDRGNRDLTAPVIRVPLFFDRLAQRMCRLLNEIERDCENA